MCGLHSFETRDLLLSPAVSSLRGKVMMKWVAFLPLLPLLVQVQMAAATGVLHCGSWLGPWKVCCYVWYCHHDSHTKVTQVYI
jgi:hypothetical protein